jgi:hypothetical protein
VRALDVQRVALNEQLELLRERQALERAGLSDAQAAALTQKTITKAATATTAARKEEKDEIAEIQKKIAENKKLQAEYAAQGLETNDLVSQELSLYRQLAAAQSRRGTDNTGTLAQIDALQAGMSDESGGRSGGGTSLAGLLETDEEGGLIPLDELLAGSETGEGSGVGGRIADILGGVSDSYQTFVDEVETLKRNTGEINPFQTITDFLDEVQEIDSFEGFVNVFGTLAKNLFNLPSDLLQSLFTGLSDMLGLQLDPAVRDGINLILDMAGNAVAILAAGGAASALAGGVAAIGAAAAANPITLLALAIGGLIAVINRFGPDALNTLNDLAAVIRIAFDDVKTEIDQKVDAFVCSS